MKKNGVNSLVCASNYMQILRRNQCVYLRASFQNPAVESRLGGVNHIRRQDDQDQCRRPRHAGGAGSRRVRCRREIRSPAHRHHHGSKGVHELALSAS